MTMQHPCRYLILSLSLISFSSFITPRRASNTNIIAMNGKKNGTHNSTVVRMFTTDTYNMKAATCHKTRSKVMYVHSLICVSHT